MHAIFMCMRTVHTGHKLVMGVVFVTSSSIEVDHQNDGALSPHTVYNAISPLLYHYSLSRECSRLVYYTAITGSY